MYVTPPWEPTAIVLTVATRAPWWMVGEAAQRPERWTVRADVDPAQNCPPQVQHVGHLDVIVVEMADDAPLPLPWCRDFVAEAVADPAAGTLATELEQVIAPGPARLVILHRLSLHESWRGCGLSAPLLGAALQRFAVLARLAACRIRADDMAELVPELPGRSAECAAAHAGRLLAQAGFVSWRGVHVLGLHDDVQHDLAAEATDTDLDAALEDLLAAAPDDEPRRNCS